MLFLHHLIIVKRQSHLKNISNKISITFIYYLCIIYSPTYYYILLHFWKQRSNLLARKIIKIICPQNTQWHFCVFFLRIQHEYIYLSHEWVLIFPDMQEDKLVY